MTYDFSFDKKSALGTLACLVAASLLLLFAGYLLGRDSSRNFSVPPDAKTLGNSAKKARSPTIGEPLQQSASATQAAAAPPSSSATTDGTDTEVPAKNTTKASEGYTLQFGAFREKGNAEALVKSLKEQGIKATIFSASDLSGQNWFAVRSGSYASPEEASQAAVELRKTAQTTLFVRPLKSL